MKKINNLLTVCQDFTIISLFQQVLSRPLYINFFSSFFLTHVHAHTHAHTLTHISYFPYSSLVFLSTYQSPPYYIYFGFILLIFFLLLEFMLQLVRSFWLLWSLTAVFPVSRTISHISYAITRHLTIE